MSLACMSYVDLVRIIIMKMDLTANIPKFFPAIIIRAYKFIFFQK